MYACVCVDRFKVADFVKRYPGAAENAAAAEKKEEKQKKTKLQANDKRAASALTAVKTKKPKASKS